jgi:hypothetical protein
MRRIRQSESERLGQLSLLGQVTLHESQDPENADFPVSIDSSVDNTPEEN